MAKDDFAGAKEKLPELQSAVEAIDSNVLTDDAKGIWDKERTNLAKLIADLQRSEDINGFRAGFKSLSEEVGVLAKTFGFGTARTVYELHCPMAFQNRGAVWYQDNEQVRNPYFGNQMLKCADSVKPLMTDQPENPGVNQSHPDHSQH